jgi:hypothetical protein
MQIVVTLTGQLQGSLGMNWLMSKLGKLGKPGKGPPAPANAMLCAAAEPISRHTATARAKPRLATMLLDLTVKLILEDSGYCQGRALGYLLDCVAS